MNVSRYCWQHLLLCFCVSVSASAQETRPLFAAPGGQQAVHRLPPPDVIEVPGVVAAAAETVVDEDANAPADDGDTDTEVIEEVVPVPEPIWYQPWTWFMPVEWDRSFELGLTNTTGNSETFNLQAGGKLKRKTERNVFDSSIRYVKTESGSVETANQALLNVRDKMPLVDTPWNVFVQGSAEYDEFRAFDLRWASHAGVGYHFFDTDILELATRFGSGVSQEVGGPNDRYSVEASLGGDIVWEPSDRQKLSATVDYFPEWGDFGDYRLVADAGWEVVLDHDHGLSMKLSVVDRYDSTPEGRRPNDLNTAVLLIWKP